MNSSGGKLSPMKHQKGMRTEGKDNRKKNKQKRGNDNKWGETDFEWPGLARIEKETFDGLFFIA